MFEDVQKIVKSVLDIFNGKKDAKNPKACGSILEQSLVYCTLIRGKCQNKTKKEKSWKKFLDQGKFEKKF